MINFTYEDKEKIKVAYQKILFNLQNYLEQYDVQSCQEYAQIFFKMLHNGFFSAGEKVQFTSDFDYLALPLELSQGVQVMYGVCCCRHATEFLYDILKALGFDVSIYLVWVNNETSTWHKVNPTLEKANHEMVFVKDRGNILLDPVNNFSLQILENGELKQFDRGFDRRLNYYQDDNIQTVQRVLKKYYSYQELGIK